MSNLVVRSITGFFFALIIIGSILLGPMYQAMAFGLFLMLGLWEYAVLFKDTEYHQSRILSTFIGMLVYTIGILVNFKCIAIQLALSFVITLIFGVFLIELWRKQNQPIIRISIFVFGICYLVIPFTIINALSFHVDKSFPLLIGMILLIWSNDTFAYLFGRKIGKTPLFERISPKKTWEGTISGIIMTIITAALLYYLTQSKSYSFWLISALIVAPCAIFGDLLESLFKRSLKIKDTGKILPGHGGILDRFDAVLFTIPFFYLWTQIYELF